MAVGVQGRSVQFEMWSGSNVVGKKNPPDAGARFLYHVHTKGKFQVSNRRESAVVQPDDGIYCDAHRLTDGWCITGGSFLPPDHSATQSHKVN